MRTLITNAVLNGWTGTETMVRDLANELLLSGEEVVVYSPHLGRIAGDIAARGAIVVGDLHDIEGAIDVIHGHHFVPTIEALLAFPRTPALFVCHDPTAWHDVPPLNGISRYVAVDRLRKQRLLESFNIQESITTIIPNGVDTARFGKRPSPLPKKPARALLFSPKGRKARQWAPASEACERLGIDLEAPGEGCAAEANAPETYLWQYDLVFATGRSALEAMVTGAAVVLCDERGLGRLVTPDRFVRWQSLNFGLGALKYSTSAEEIVSEVSRFDAVAASEVSALARKRASARRMTERYIDLYRSISGESIDPARSVREICESACRQMAKLEQTIAAIYSTDQMRPLSGAGGIDIGINQSGAKVSHNPPAR